MQRYFLCVVLFTIILVISCASVPVAPYTEPGPIEGNYIQVGASGTFVAAYGVDELADSSIEPIMALMPSINIYGRMGLGKVDIRGAIGYTYPLGFYISCGSSGELISEKHVEFNISGDVAFSSLTDYSYDDSNRVTTIREIRAASIVVCPNLEFSVLEKKMFKLRLYSGPYVYISPVSVTLYDSIKNRITGNSIVVTGGGLHFSGMVQLLRVFTITGGGNLIIGETPYIREEGQDIMPFLCISLGF